MSVHADAVEGGCIREVLEQMAYLVVATEAPKPEPPAGCILYVEVECATPGVTGYVGILATARLVKSAAANFLNTTAVDTRLCVDVLKELANVLAGRLLDLRSNGEKPLFIRIPKPLPAAEGMKRWTAALPDQKTNLTDEQGFLGVVIVGLSTTN